VDPNCRWRLLQLRRADQRRGILRGADDFGQLGNGAPKTATDQPSAVIGGLLFTQVAPGQVHTCGLSGGAAYCWGSNLNGRLGQDTVTTTESLTPLAVTGG
jgi:Alpha-tubulin suppressor and related RCC1 domain-containing proteins